VHQAAEGAAGRIVAVNVGVPKLIGTAMGPVMSGIVKTPVSGPLMLRTLNFDGDAQADLGVHGGVAKAVYCYPHEHYAPWAAELARAAGGPGWFGENITTEGLLETTVRIGDVLRVGRARVEVTRPRSPCFKLAGRMGVRGFERMFQRSGRSGWYAMVLEEGLVGAGDVVVREAQGDGPTIAEAFGLRAEG
jgi:MOSC domain-containing protein YiiM